MIEDSLFIKRHSSSGRSRLVAACCGVLTLGAAVHAALAQEGTLEEITVTAQKRAESLQDVPIAIAAFSEGAMNDMGITSTADLALATPGLVFVQQGVLGQPYLRGVGTRFTLNGLDPSVATYVGDRYIPRGSGNQLDLGLDVERIEVLKGPQGILYGRNATGGAIRVIRKGVGDEFEGTVKATYGNYDLMEFAGTVNLPLGDTLGLRLSGKTTQRDGWQDNLAFGIAPGAFKKINDMDHSSASAVLRWKPTDAFTANLSLDYWTMDETRGQDGSHLGPTALNRGSLFGALFSTGRKVAATDGFQKNDGDQFGAELKLDYAASIVDLTSVTTYNKFDLLWTSEGDGSSAALFTPARAFDESETWSQEFRAVSNGDGPFQWTLGAFYYDDKHETEFVFFTANTPALNNNSQGKQTTDTTAYALFGQGRYQFTDAWALTVGARYSYEKREVSLVQTVRPGFGTLGAAAMPFLRDRNWDEITPSATLEYKSAGGTLTYLTWSRGFKSGGYNYPATTTALGLKPEILDMFELGLKGDYLGNTLRFNAAAFYYDYKDLQVTRAAGATGLTSTDNAANAKVYGLEADATWAPTAEFTLRVGFSVLDSKYKDYDATEKLFRETALARGLVAVGGPGMIDVAFDADGHRLLRASDYSAFATAAYEFQGPAGGRMPASVTYSYKGAYDFDFTTDPIADSYLRQGGYGLLSARIGWVSPDDRWSVSVWGKNLTDKIYFDEVAGNAQSLRGYYAEPRTYGVDLQFSF